MGDLRDFAAKAGVTGLVKEELALCKNCEGRGKVVHYEIVDWHKNRTAGSYSPCDKCNSTGRVYKQTLSLEGFRPFREE